jgi:hypothetical protein
VDVGGDPGRVDDAVEAAECLARHDDIVRCLDCGMSWPCESPFTAAQIYNSHACPSRPAA